MRFDGGEANEFFDPPSKTASSVQDRFSRNIATTIHWRWNSIVDALESLLDKKALLQQLWSVERFTMQRAAAAESDKGDAPHFARQLDVKIIDHTIRNPSWWAFGNMVLQVHALAKEFGQWAESCPCHDHFRRASAPLDVAMRDEMQQCRAQCALVLQPDRIARSLGF